LTQSPAAHPDDPIWLKDERARIADTVARHSRIVLQFSGGKDSLATLELLRPHWKRLTVAWANSGDPFPETLALMADVRARVPNFVEVRGDQPKHIAELGWPVDLIPVKRTPFGRLMHRDDLPNMQGYPLCCGANLWEPMRRFVTEQQATLIIRGSKAADDRRGAERAGSILDGVEFLLPVFGWTDEQTFAFLRREGVEIPEHYAFGTTSLDCRHCTAFLDENAAKMRFMRERHPGDFAEVQRRLREIKRAVVSDLSALDACII
jgi:phosphoadenosine phosphosulfate reductase